MSISIEQQAERARTRLMASAEVTKLTAELCLESIAAAAELIAASFRAGGKLLLCGNGGSAADCQHLATEFVSMMEKEFQRPPLPAIALTTYTSFLTAFSNDFGYERVFERQVQAHGKPGDVLIGISTSGNSPSVLCAVEAAHGLGMKTIGLTGSGGRLASIADVTISIPSSDTQQIQETHLAVEHILCDLVECHLFNKAELPGT
jgi:D-sedoheptulose 7-phosphate isomerase